MDKQKIILLETYREKIQTSTNYFRSIGLSDGAKHYIFNYMSIYSTKIISIILSIELERVKPGNLNKDLEAITTFMGKLELIHKKVEDNNFLLELEKKFNDGILDTNELLDLLLIEEGRTKVR